MCFVKVVAKGIKNAKIPVVNTNSHVVWQKTNDQGRTRIVSVDSQSWIKPAIANILNRRNPDEDVRVRVEKLDYGIFVWDEADQIHVHVNKKDLKIDLGKRYDEYINSCVLVQLSWDDIRVWKGVEL